VDEPIMALTDDGTVREVKNEMDADMREASEIMTSATMVFTFDTTEFIDKELVIYEELYRIENNGTETLVASHKDSKDTKQTVKIATPKIETTATDKVDGDKEIEMDTTVVIVDAVNYEGLVPGDTYTLIGELRDKATGDVVKLSDGTTKVVVVFEATRDKGVEEMEFEIKTDGMTGKELVVFEELYYGKEVEEEVDEITGEVIVPGSELTEEDLLAVHKDLKSESQTVSVRIEVPDTGFVVRGDEGAKVRWLFVVPVVVAILGFGALVGYRIYKRHNFGW
jgi:hypothetical protein